MEIIGIVVNEKGLKRALATPGVTTLGYPHSLSPTFLEANARMSIERSRALIRELSQATEEARRDFVVYLSMAFGNPYNDPWSRDQAAEEALWLKGNGVPVVSLADTVGQAGPEGVARLVDTVLAAVRDGGGIEIGVHLHSRQENAAEKVVAAYDAGCRRFDSALTGLGGCPFAGDELVGNIPTEVVIPALERRGARTGIAMAALERALGASRELRERYTHG
jgi:hydroxymethylglutaryl-CoA lyase